MAFGHPFGRDQGPLVSAGVPVLPRDLVMLILQFPSLMRIYANLYVAYAVVPPAHLASARTFDFPAHMDPEMVETFVAAYDGGAGAPGPWKCGRKEYFEVPKEDIPQLGGLYGLISAMGTLRENMISHVMLDYEALPEEGKATRFRLMSWRDI